MALIRNPTQSMAGSLWRGIFLAFIICISAACALTANAQTFNEPDFAAARVNAEKTFKTNIAPFLSTYCIDCHGDKKRKGGITFRAALKNPSASSLRKQWKVAATTVKAHDMPPDDAAKQPSEEESKMFVDWVATTKFLSPKDPGIFEIRRLNKEEYRNTLHDLLGAPLDIANALPEEVFGAGYLNSFSPLLMEQYMSIANNVLSRVLAPEGEPPNPLEKKLFGEQPSRGADPKEAARKVAHTLARSAYRRPASEAEVDVLLGVFDLANKNGRSYASSLRLMLKAILVSPQFLFITPEGDTPTDTDIVPLDDYQLASRISYLLWSSPPDQQLAALADNGTLHEPQILKTQVARLLNDPRSRALFDGFGAQWLGIDKLASKPFDSAKFPEMNDTLRAAMAEEARLFFESIVKDNLNVVTFIDADYTYLNETLAHIYGLGKEITGTQMRKIHLKDANRGGILGMPGVLANTSFPNRTSPVNRGVWVLEQVLGEHVPPAPPNVPALEKQNKTDIANLTLRQRTELHRANATCANCHKILDPIGFGLENFDAIGRWRNQDDSGGAIDAVGQLPGDKKFSSPRELKSILATRNEDLCRNLTEKLLAYALGRQLEGYDEIVVDQLTDAIKKDGYRMQTLITQVVLSYPFTHRRIQEQEGVSNGKKLVN